jgi:hypothetical protein
MFSISKIQKKKRKIGGFEIYVDEECRENYLLEDYSDFIEKNMQDDIQINLYEYKRCQAIKPLSFLGVHRQNI